MKTDLTSLRDVFTTTYFNLQPFYDEAKEVLNLYHNAQFSAEELQEFKDAGLEPESFNIIKAFSRMLIGYYSAIVTGFRADPLKPQDAIVADVLNDVLEHILDDNEFDVLGEFIKFQGILTGLFIAKSEAQIKQDMFGNPSMDMFGRKIVRADIDKIDIFDIVFDTDSREADFKDLEHIHYKKWLNKATLEAMFKEKSKDIQAYYDFTGTDSTPDGVINSNKTFDWNINDKYLIVQSYVKNDKGTWELIIWHDQLELYRQEIEYMPFVMTYLERDTKGTIYGAFREIISAQHNLNIALLKIAKYVNAEKVIVQETSVDDIKKFERDYKNLSKIAVVRTLAGIKIEKYNLEIQQQLMIADKALDRIQFILGINDSFLGQAFASDSGRKVKLQQNSSMMRLRYIDTKLNLFYKNLGLKLLELIRRYYKATQIIALTDNNIQKFLTINKPLTDRDGNLIIREAVDDKGIIMTDENGKPIVEPVHDYHTDIRYADVKLRVTSTNYLDEREQTQVAIETVMNGAIGQVMMSINPQGYLKMGSLLVDQMNFRNKTKVVDVLEQTAMMLQPQPQMQGALAGRGSQQGYAQASADNRLPQTTQQEEGNV